MKATPIELTTRFGEDALRVSLRWHFKYPAWVRRLLLLLIVLVPLYLLLALVAGGRRLDPKPLLLLGAVLLLRRVSLPFFQWWFRRRYPAYKQDIRWKFHQEGFVQDTGSGERMLLWSAIHRCTLTPDGFLIYPRREHFSWIPVTAFRSPDDCQRFSEMLKEKTKWKSKT